MSDAERISALRDLLHLSGAYAVSPPLLADEMRAAVYVCQEAIGYLGLGPGGDGYCFTWDDDSERWPWCNLVLDDIAVIAASHHPDNAAKKQHGNSDLYREVKKLFKNESNRPTVVHPGLYVKLMAKAHYMIARLGNSRDDLIDRIAYETEILRIPYGYCLNVVIYAACHAEDKLRWRGWLKPKMERMGL